MGSARAGAACLEGGVGGDVKAAVVARGREHALEGLLEHRVGEGVRHHDHAAAHVHHRLHLGQAHLIRHAAARGQPQVTVVVQDMLEGPLSDEETAIKTARYSGPHTGAFAQLTGDPFASMEGAG